MKEKLYSINHVQEMIDISPADLQKMLKKNAKVLHLIREDRGNGRKEVFIDEESLQKLIFIRQLENGAPVTDSAVCEMIKVPELNSLKTSSKKKSLGIKFISLPPSQYNVIIIIGTCQYRVLIILNKKRTK